MPWPRTLTSPRVADLPVGVVMVATFYTNPVALLHLHCVAPLVVACISTSVIMISTFNAEPISVKNVLDKFQSRRRRQLLTASQP